MHMGLCLSDPNPDLMNVGSAGRTISAVRFAGRYRLVDFMLSNMVNSGIYNIGIILNSQYQSLIGHIGMGKEWDLARKSGGVTFFPPYMSDERNSVNNEPYGPLQRAASYLAASAADYVVLTDSAMVYNMDYRGAIRAHIDSGADVTAIYAKKRISSGKRESYVAFDIADDGHVHGISAAPHSSDMLNISLGAYVMEKTFFLKLIANKKNCGMLRFSREILAGALVRLNVIAYEFKGYSAQVCSVETFFEHNMEMLDIEKRNALFDFEGRRISTSRRDSLPTKYGKQAQIINSIVADGCQIEGTVENSVIFRNVHVRPGAAVKNCILQEKTVVEKNASLEWIVSDCAVVFSEGRNMAGYRTYPTYIEKERLI